MNGDPPLGRVAGGTDMSLQGMQLPGGRQARQAGLTVYTALAAVAAVALATAGTVLYFAAARVSPESSNPIALQKEGSIRVPTDGGRR